MFKLSRLFLSWALGTALLLAGMMTASGGNSKSDRQAASEQSLDDLLNQQINFPSNIAKLKVTKPRSVKEIKDSGVLRILTIREPELPHLQRGESVQDRELALLTSLCDWLEVQAQLIYVETYDQLIPALIAGQGDIISANMSITPERQKQVLFSVPIDSVSEQLVGPAKNPIRNLAELNEKTAIIEKGTCYGENLNELRRRYPGLKVNSSNNDTETLLSKVGAGAIDATVADDNYIDNYLKYRTDIKAIYTFPTKRLTALALAKKSEELKKTIDAFLRKELPYLWTRTGNFDLASIKRRHVIRVITRDNPVNYFIHRGKMMGFEYELAQKFAENNRLHMVIIIPPHYRDMIPWLLDGKGDIIAATMTATEERKEHTGIAFCNPYMTVNEVVVTRKNDHTLKSFEDLTGRTFAVRADSSYLETLNELKSKGLKFNIKILPDTIDSFEILEGVADGTYDLTLVDDVFLKAKLQSGDNLKSVLNAAKAKKYAWIVRKSSPELLAAVNAFFQKEYRGTFFNILCRRYFDFAQTGRQFKEESNAGKNLISPFDEIIKKHAQNNNFDWCLIAAQIYHESQFNHKTIAPDGGMGLMQLMPATAKQLKCHDPLNPDSNIKAGTVYMGKLRNIFTEPVLPLDQLCFALASYNGGYGHVLDARLLAAEMGLNPNVWRNNVEVAMSKLSTTEYAARARFGFCRSDIINNYVRGIMLRFYHYQQMAKAKAEEAKP